MVMQDGVPILQIQGGMEMRRTALNPRMCRERREGYILIAPVCIHIFIFVIIPIVYAFILSFQEWNMLSPDKDFVGLGNYERMLSDSVFFLSLKNTLWYTVWSVPFCLVLSLLLAVAMKRRSAVNSFLRTCFFLPVIVSLVVTSVVFTWLFDPMIGLVNYYLGKIGIGPLVWLSDPDLALPTLVIVSIWKSLGYNMVIFLAAIIGVDASLYEAVEIDGGNRFQQIIHIMLPSIAPVVVLVMTLSLGGLLNGGFDQILVLYNPMVYEGGDIIDTFVYRLGMFGDRQVDVASAVNLAKSFITILLVGGSYLFAYKKFDYKIF